MRKFMRKSRRGFSFIELLAVVLILAVLAGVAVPMYINSRRTAAARTCYANLRAIQSAETAHYLRNGAWITGTSTAGLVGLPEGLAKTVTCPLTSSANDYTLTASGANLVVACPNQANHTAVYTTYPVNITLTAPGADTLP